MTRSLGFAACLLALAVIPAPGQDKSTTPLRNFTTLQVEDVRIAPELAHLRFGIPPGTASGSEATEAIRRNIVEEVKGQHMFHRVTDVEKPETVTPETEPDDVQVKPEIAYGQGLNSRFRRRADVEDAKVPKPAAERILLLRCEIVEHQPPSSASATCSWAIWAKGGCFRARPDHGPLSAGGQGRRKCGVGASGAELGAPEADEPILLDILCGSPKASGKVHYCGQPGARLPHGVVL